MINMDMIGRMRDGRSTSAARAPAARCKKDLESAAANYPALQARLLRNRLRLERSHSFTAKQVPVLFFFSGLHADYHKPSDTWDKIDAPGCGQAAAPDRRYRAAHHRRSRASRISPRQGAGQPARRSRPGSGSGGGGYGP